MKKLILILGAALLLSPACSKIDREDNLRGDQLAPLVPIQLTQREQLTRNASNDFGINTFRILYGEGQRGDVAFSPLSLTLALAMAAEGAEGETWQQFADVIGWGDATKEEVGAFYHKMIQGLVKADLNVQFSSANSFWANKQLHLRSGYVSRLKEYFEAEAYEVDFSLPATLAQINKWCSDKTDGKIPRLLDRVDPDTALILINALLFKAPWRLTWDILPNRDFQTPFGTAKKDYLFVRDQQLTYGDFGDFELVRAPYGNTAYQMDIILPKKGKTLSEILPQVESGAVNYSLKPTEVTLYLPKWSLEYSTGDALIPALKRQGLTLPFGQGSLAMSDTADFSGISDEALCISNILQKVKIDVTEKGTEFAAVTGIVMDNAASAPVSYPRVTVDVNRPFAYTIRETTSGTILLLGTLSK